MHLTVKKRLELLMSTDEKIQKKILVFDPRRPNFGFRHMQQMFPVDFDDEIKGVPTVAWNGHLDHMKFAIKIIPLESKYEADVHPSRLEGRYLQELTKLVKSWHTPHITYYFTEFEVPNNVKALTCFPLKEYRHELYKKSTILVTEFVSGGSLEEWIQTDETAVIADGQWKYILFSVIWTLFVVQDKYRLVHADLHFGNVLVDTSLSQQEKGFLEYRLLVDGKERTFHVPTVGLRTTIIDWEFAHAHKGLDGIYPNRFGAKEDNIPSYFNPVYDLHCFCASLLDMNIPTSVKEFILSVYPPELIPAPAARKHRSFGGSSEDSGDSSCSGDSGVEEDEDFSLHSDELDGSQTNGRSASSDNCYWRTDETMETTMGSDDGLSDMAVDELAGSASEEEDENPDGSQIRTEYLLGERLLNGTEDKFVGLPTPYSLLHHPYFDEYIARPSPSRRAAATFTWTTRYDPALDSSKPKGAKEGKEGRREKRGKSTREKVEDVKILAQETKKGQETKGQANKVPLQVNEGKKLLQDGARPAAAKTLDGAKPKEKAKPALKRKAGDNEEHDSPAADSAAMPVPQPLKHGGTLSTKRVPVLRVGPTPPKGHTKSKH
jgi:hypothetical protein